MTNITGKLGNDSHQHVIVKRESSHFENNTSAGSQGELKENSFNLLDMRNYIDVIEEDIRRKKQVNVLQQKLFKVVREEIRLKSLKIILILFYNIFIYNFNAAFLIE